MELFKDSVQTIKGIGPKKAKLLARLGIYTLEDALNHFPRDYEICPGVTYIDSLKDGEMVSLCVKFKGKPQVIRKSRNLSIVRWSAVDDTGSIVCTWFNQPYRANQYRADVLYYVYGKAVFGYGQIQVQNPKVEEYDKTIHDQCIINPIYSLTEGLTQRDLRNLLSSILKRIDGSVIDELPGLVRKRYALVEKSYALENIHFPKDQQALKWSRRRLVFEELFITQMALYAIRKNLRDNKKGFALKWDKKAEVDFIKSLPFTLTGAQQRAAKEILEDIKKDIPMNRLIYGDVGSGKTVVAAIALYAAFMGGYQGVLMAPTEILARQHYKSLTSLFKSTGIRIGLLVGGMSDRDKKNMKNLLSQGQLDIIIATHAVLEDDVKFYKLGLVITDEQHRFGVRQRAVIEQKGVGYPHVLVMSATPIPRTLALILYGDLDISLIDDLPPGRKPIKTYHVPSSMRNRVYGFIRKQAQMGYQTYLVCPLIEESDKISAASAIEMYEELKDGPLAGLTLGLLHGKMNPDEKAEIMAKFEKGNIQVLISTTVIEVGVNVANANLMVIENADRFGLAQLHQLRGRVGRSSSQAYCILIADTKTSYARERMNIMVKTNNGFEISQKDLELRGPGEFLGVRQHGLPEFKISNLIRDMDILKEVQEAAQWIMESGNYQIRDDVLNNAYTKFYRQIQKVAFN